MTQSLLTEYIDELFKMMKANKRFDEKRTVFGPRAVQIGHDIFDNYGSSGLFNAMHALCDMIIYQSSKHQNEYFTDLRELEFKWDGITDDFQC